MLSFDTPDIHALLDAATPEAIQAATFGIVRVNIPRQSRGLSICEPLKGARSDLEPVAARNDVLCTANLN